MEDSVCVCSHTIKLYATIISIRSRARSYSLEGATHSVMRIGPVFLGFQHRYNVALVIFEQAEGCTQVMTFEHRFVVVQQRYIGAKYTYIHTYIGLFVY